MKFLLSASSCLALGLLFSLSACVSPDAPRKTTVLIDYDDGIAGNGIHEASIRNGGFEKTSSNVNPAKQGPEKKSNKKNAPSVVPSNYRDIEAWTNATGNSGDPVVSATYVHEGNRKAVFGAANDRPKPNTPSQKTGYIIKSKDIFSLSAWYARWREPGKVAETDDHAQAVLYALDGETEVEIARFDMKDLEETYTQCTGTTAPIFIRSPVVGKELLIKFMYIDVDGDGQGRMRLDAVTLTVASL